MRMIFYPFERGRNLLLLLLLFIWVNTLLSSFLPKDHALDLKFAYTVEEAYHSLNQLDPDQREIYIFGVWALDMPYLIIYFFFFSGLLRFLHGNRKFYWVPLLISLTDFIENLLLLRILKLFPDTQSGLVRLCSFFTTSKWIFVGGLVICLLMGVWSFLSQRKKTSSSSQEIRI